MGWVLGFRQRRAMGLTFRGVRTILKEMDAAGELEGKTNAQLAAEVLSRAVDQKPEAFGDPAIDWDAILVFIEKLISLILKIISLFA
jgi:hypothetical protein